jgi:hypothetical protein
VRVITPDLPSDSTPTAGLAEDADEVRDAIRACAPPVAVPNAKMKHLEALPARYHDRDQREQHGNHDEDKKRSLGVVTRITEPCQLIDQRLRVSRRADRLLDLGSLAPGDPPARLASHSRSANRLRSFHVLRSEHRLRSMCRACRLGRFTSTTRSPALVNALVRVAPNDPVLSTPIAAI